MPAIVVPEELEKQLTPAGSRALVHFLNETFDDERSHTLEIVEDRFALRVVEAESRLRREIGESESRLRHEMSELGSSLRKEMGDMEIRLTKLFADSRADTIKWAFIFWVTQMAAFAALFLRQ